MTIQARHTRGWVATAAGVALMVASPVLAQTGPPIYGVTGTLALEGTIDQEQAAAHTVVVKAIDGTRHVFHAAKTLVVHGAPKGGADALRDLRAGTTVVVHYTGTGADAAVKELDLIGDRGLQTTEGMVEKIDRRRRQITIRFDDRTTETFRLTERAAQDVGREIDDATVDAGKVVVYFADQQGQKVAHFFRRVS
jgi:hypothetical protein